ncbi:MAG: Fe-S cluster assembly protein SufD [Planctomycetales bacterium]|nr:Fe-S cluster assembly protein SufD [Planctomycetales bacterium]
MPETLSPTEFTSASLARFIESRQEPAWVTERRQAAWDAFESLGWPQRNEEEWIRTDIRLFKLDAFQPPVSTPSLDEVSFSGTLAQGVALAGNTVARDGISVAATLTSRWTEQGVVFGSLDHLVHSHGDLIQKYMLVRAVDPQFDRFSALHAAFWSGGTFLYVPRGVVIDEPLHILASLADKAVDMGHVLIVLEEGAEATVLTEMVSDGESAGGLHCGAVELFVGPHARLRYVGLQDWGKNVWHFGHEKALVGRDATLQWTIGALGSKLSKVNQHVALVGTGAESQVNGTMFTEDRQHLSYHTLQHHEAPHCRSDFLYKAALQDKSRTVWRGMIKVDPDAQKTDGYQRNDNLLLSNQARADSIPGLEIEADDVRCTHGSTTGKVDEELIFYAQSRGFTRQEAIRMVVTGFFQQIFDRITIESVRDALGNAIARRVREYE